MNQQLTSRSWGECSLRLNLPVAGVQFRGLSETQYRLLSEEYSNYLSDFPDTVHQGDVICSAYQLDQAVTIPLELTTRDGQYAPLKIRDSEGIDLTGVNFRARVELGTSGSRASLGVAEEFELPQASVVENFLRIFSAHSALDRGGVILHSAGLVFDEKAFIFSGRSNAGKTTLTRKAYEYGASVLSDDINLLLPAAGGYSAHAVPFTGEFGRTLQHKGERKSYPVAGVILLEQADALAVEPVKRPSAVARLLTACPFVNYDKEESESLFDVLTDLVEMVPVIRLLSRKHDGIEAIMAMVSEELKHA